MRTVAGLLVILFAPASFSQTVSAVGGKILFQDATGRTTLLTTDQSDSDPCLSADNERVVFVRSTPNRKAGTGLGEIELTELWVASVDQKQPPKRVLVGHPGDFKPGPTLVMAGFSKPQFSPNGERVYFMAETWATSTAIHVLDLKTGQTRFLYAGLDVEVIGSGKYEGFLIATENPVAAVGRYTVYLLMNPDGKGVRRIGYSESDVARFKASM